MNPRLLELYNQELHHVRESAAEFAKEYPKIASRLTLSGMDCADPYVERLLEGFAYLTARVQLKLDAEYRPLPITCWKSPTRTTWRPPRR